MTRLKERKGVLISFFYLLSNKHSTFFFFFFFFMTGSSSNLPIARRSSLNPRNDSCLFSLLCPPFSSPSFFSSSSPGMNSLVTVAERGKREKEKKENYKIVKPRVGREVKGAISIFHISFNYIPEALIFTE